MIISSKFISLIAILGLVHFLPAQISNEDGKYAKKGLPNSFLIGEYEHSYDELLEQYSRSLVSVCDNGPGLPPGDPEQVFQRFFTTKAYGFGIGLAICRDVIERQRGSIRAQNNPGAGSTFTFSLLVQSSEVEKETRRLEEAENDLLDDNTVDDR